MEDETSRFETEETEQIEAQISQPAERPPALTITIQSWWTPAIGAIMLLIGLLAGYYGRPYLAQLPQATNITGSPATVASGTEPEQITSNLDEIMAEVVAQTRHFKGDPNAPVTIIEFSDFQ